MSEAHKEFNEDVVETELEHQNLSFESSDDQRASQAGTRRSPFTTFAAIVTAPGVSSWA